MGCTTSLATTVPTPPTSVTPSNTPRWRPKDDEGKVLYLGPDRAGNVLEVATVTRAHKPELVIHAMRMRRIYEPMLRNIGDTK